MSKIIKITQECIEEIRQEFEQALRGAKVSDGKISFTKTFGTINRKATVYFTDMAWLKMQTLIREFDKEVAWHGVAYRGEDESKDEYYITDILVYPQEVTGATVNTDQEKYEMWLMQHDDDVFNNIRMQGHSHVNMGTTPSGVDLTHQEQILNQLEDDMFYIFMIWNKKGDKNIKVYDLAKNILFDGSDVSVVVEDDGTGMSSFLSDAKEMVQDKKPATPVTYSGAGASGYYNNYYGNYYDSPYYGGGRGGVKTSYSNSSGSTVGNNKSSGGSNSVSAGNKKKAKRKGTTQTANNPNNASSGQLSMFDDEDDRNWGWR